MQRDSLSAGLAEREAHAFATTRWSVVLAAANEISPLANSALESLCKAYWYPLYSYVRRCGYDPPTAKDLTQEFFARLLGKQLLAGVDPTRGKFRSWLLGVMKHFLAHEWTRARAQKRGGGQPVFSWDELDAEERYLLEPAEESPPERAFDRRWALTILEHAASRLREEYAASGRGKLYEFLKPFVSVEAPEVRYEEAARQLEITTSATRSAIHRLRQRYQELVRAEIAETVSSVAEIDEEIHYLLSVIRSR